MEKGENKTVKLFFSDSGAGLSGEEDGKTEVTEDTVTTRRSNLIFKLSFFYRDFEFGSIELSIHSIVLACG